MTLVLAVIGLYCSLSLLVRQRTSEIGVRLALGATRGRVFGLTFREGSVLLFEGWVAGTALAILLARLLQHLLFEVVSLDVMTFLSASAGVFGVGAIACAVPSWRASRLDVMNALRTE